jgi:hypothetical protein
MDQGLRVVARDTVDLSISIFFVGKRSLSDTHADPHG